MQTWALIQETIVEVSQYIISFTDIHVSPMVSFKAHTYPAWSPLLPTRTLHGLLYCPHVPCMVSFIVHTYPAWSPVWPTRTLHGLLYGPHVVAHWRDLPLHTLHTGVEVVYHVPLAFKLQHKDKAIDTTILLKNMCKSLCECIQSEIVIKNVQIFVWMYSVGDSH